jgi:hypothetical protein
MMGQASDAVSGLFAVNLDKVRNTMKYLSNYTETPISKALEEHGGFFAFSTEQFEREKKEGVTYVNMGSGLIAPKDNAKKLFEALDKAHREGIKQDIAENGKEAIIKRELYNYECFYVGCVDDCVDALEDYGYTRQEILKVYNAELDHALETCG